jgi:deazaflavin-dependent oxidoreductase (nitroreductase family)
MARNPLVHTPKPIMRGFSALHRAMFNLTGGRLGGKFRGSPTLMLTTTGRKTGKEPTWPLLALPVGDGYAIAGSNSGYDQHPAWYLNLKANPEVTFEVRGQRTKARARDATPQERAELYPKFIDVYSGYRDYEAATDRKIPVVLLEPIAG